MGLAFWLEQAGFSYVTLVPPIWVKPNKTQGIIGDPRKGMIVSYEAMIFAAKGDAVLLKQGRQNIFIHDTLSTSERDFAMQMPVDYCAEIISMVSLGGGRILDPFAGSGSIGEGALELQCEYKGYELNPKRAELGNLRLQEHLFASQPDTPKREDKE
jgi:site-specific DNA-methyltransferase (adenine-specific)